MQALTSCTWSKMAFYLGSPSCSFRAALPECSRSAGSRAAREADPMTTVARPLCTCVSWGINLPKSFQSISRHGQTEQHSCAATLNWACLYCRESASWDGCELQLTNVVITCSNPGNFNSKSGFWVQLECNHCRTLCAELIILFIYQKPILNWYNCRDTPWLCTCSQHSYIQKTIN